MLSGRKKLVIIIVVKGSKSRFGGCDSKEEWIMDVSLLFITTAIM